jgi:prevent-host-death family protein
MVDTTLPLAEIKKRLSEIVDRVEENHERVVLTRNGRPAAVILSPDDLEALEETLDILSDPETMRAIREAEADLAAGRFITGEDLRRMYPAR